MKPEDFPANDYVVLSKVVVDVLEDRNLLLPWERIGVLSLKGFSDPALPHLVRSLSALQLSRLV